MRGTPGGSQCDEAFTPPATSSGNAVRATSHAPRRADPRPGTGARPGAGRCAHARARAAPGLRQPGRPESGAAPDARLQPRQSPGDPPAARPHTRPRPGDSPDARQPRCRNSWPCAGRPSRPAPGFRRPARRAARHAPASRRPARRASALAPERRGRVSTRVCSLAGILARGFLPGAGLARGRARALAAGRVGPGDAAGPRDAVSACAAGLARGRVRAGCRGRSHPAPAPRPRSRAPRPGARTAARPTRTRARAGAAG